LKKVLLSIFRKRVLNHDLYQNAGTPWYSKGEFTVNELAKLERPGKHISINNARDKNLRIIKFDCPSLKIWKESC
jgi:hypothetical protein